MGVFDAAEADEIKAIMANKQSDPPSFAAEGVVRKIVGILINTERV